MAGGSDVQGNRRNFLTPQQRLKWLQLIRSENVGPATFRDLINHYGTAAAALEALPDLTRRGGPASHIKIASVVDAEREMAATERAGARFVASGEPDYPVLLRGLDNPPPLLCVRGQVPHAPGMPIAIVGARNASISGQKLAAKFSRELGEAGHAIISGLARGIDASAHRAALRTGTVAVFAGGIDRPYPEENASLAEEIVANGGALISEMPIGWSPRNIDFPRRNRIVAGLAIAVLVIEAAKRSGSLITARLATECGRQVLAVPGSPLDPRSEGGNHLIRQGAILATSSEDVLEAIRPLSGADQQDYFVREADTGEREFNQDAVHDVPQTLRDRVVEALGPTPVEVDEIVRHTGARVGEVQLVLLELALAGRLERHSGGRVSLQM